MSKLKDLRIKRNLSQKELANISGVSIRHVQHYEQGYRSIDGAGLEKLVAFAIALNCNISEIIEDPVLVAKCEELGI